MRNGWLGQVLQCHTRLIDASNAGIVFHKGLLHTLEGTLLDIHRSPLPAQHLSICF